MSVREVVEAHLRRIDAVKPAVNAIVIRLDEQALAAADVADRMAGTGAGLAVSAAAALEQALGVLTSIDPR